MNQDRQLRRTSVGTLNIRTIRIASDDSGLGLGRPGAEPDGTGPYKFNLKPMLLISSSHEKQTAIKPRASRDREF